MIDRHRLAVWLRVLMLPGAVIGGFVLFQGPMRDFEAYCTVAILRIFGASGDVPIVSGSSILVVPSHSSAFWVAIEPSCSSLASVLALAALATLLPRTRLGGSRLLSAAIACICVFLGNLIRISSSVAIGITVGRQSLVLFHDWVGSVFGFAYTLGGFVLMLWLLLPRRARTEAQGATATGSSLAAVSAS